MQDIRQLANSDLVLSLAKLRIELEKVIRRVAAAAADGDHSERAGSLGLLVQRLERQELIPRDMAGPLREVIGICNRAVHGEAIAEADARSIIELGTDLLEALYWGVKELLNGQILSEEVIDSATVDNYQRKRYRLTTVIPLVDRPKRVVREVSHENLEDYLEGYSEFAEFAVELIEIPDDQG